MKNYMLRNFKKAFKEGVLEYMEIYYLWGDFMEEHKKEVNKIANEVAEKMMTDRIIENTLAQAYTDYLDENEDFCELCEEQNSRL